MSDHKPQSVPLVKKRWLQIVTGLLVSALLVLLLLPFAVRYSLEKWLVSQGAQSAQIKGVKINLFAGTVSVTGVEVKVDDRVVLADNDVALNLSLTSLFKKEGHLQTGILTGLILDVVIREDGSLRIGSITAAPGASPEADKEKKDFGWVIRASRVELRNCLIHFSTPNLQEDIYVRNAVLTRFVTGSSTVPANLTLEGTINNAPLTLELNKIDLSAGVDVAGHLAIGSSVIDDLQGILQEALDPVSGVLELEGDFAVSRLRSGALAGSFDGTMSVENLALGNASFQTTGSRLLYEGAVGYQQDSKGESKVDVNGLLQGNDIELTLPGNGFSFKEEELKLDGKTQVVLVNGVSVVTDVSLSSSNFAMNLAGMGGNLSGLQWQGHVEYDLISDEANQTVSVEGGLTLKKPIFSMEGEGAGLNTEAALLSWQGKVDLDIGDSDAGTTILVDGALAGKEIGLVMPGLAVRDDALVSEGRTEISTGSELIISHDSRRLELTGASVTAANTSSSGLGLAWQGRVDYSAGAEKSAVALDGSLTGKLLEVKIPEVMDFANKEVTFSGKTDVFIRPKLRVVHDGELLFGPVNFTNAALKASSGSLSWKGQSGYQLAPQQLSLNGKLNIASLQSQLIASGLAVNLEQLSGDSKDVKLQLAEQISLEGKASLAADKLAVARGEVPLVQLGRVDVQDISGAEQGIVVKDIGFKELAVPSSADQPYTVAVPGIMLTGLASPDFSSINLQNIAINGIRVSDSRTKSLLAKMKKISGTGLKVDSKGAISLVEAGAVKGEFLKKAGKKEKPEVEFARLQLNKISWSAVKGVFCDRIELNNLSTGYVRGKTAGKETKPSGKEKVNPEKKTGKSMPVRINSIAVTGKSGFQFVDRVTSIPFQTTLVLDKLEIKDINSASAEKPLTYELKGVFDKHAPITVSGTAAPFADKLAVDAEIRLRNYNLQALSPYIVDAIGTKFVDGQLDIASVLKLNGDSMDLENDLVLKQIKAETITEELLAKLNNELPVSLDMALSMLRDNRGDVKLSVPVSGELAHLSVNPTDIIVTALGKAIVVTVTPYLAYTVLGPAGALVYAGMEIGEELIDTSLPGLEFEQGKSELSDAHIKVLKEVGKQIKKDKKQDYSVCSRISVWELAGDVERNNENQQKILSNEAARKKMMDLAEKRAQNVWDYLHRHYLIGKERLLICSPTVDFSQKGSKGTINFRK